MQRWRSQLCAVLFVALTKMVSPAGLIFGAQQQAPPAQIPSDVPDRPGEEADSIPVMFPHPETDLFWISGQANFISQWHPAFHSPYQGRNSLSPEAQDATSRVLTLYTGL